METIHKIDKYIGVVWLAFLPTLFATFALFVALWEFDFIHPNISRDGSVAFLNAVSLMAVIYLSGWIINLLVLNPIYMIREKAAKREKEAEEIIELYDRCVGYTFSVKEGMGKANEEESKHEDDR